MSIHCKMLPKYLAVLLLICSLTPLSGAETDSSFILETKSWQSYTPGFIGNGHFSIVTTPLAITDAESYMAWVFDHGPEDVPRIAVLPAWNGIDIYDGEKWLSKINPSEQTIRDYNQRIDMYQGILQTQYSWHDGEKITDVEVESFVSRSKPEIAAIKLTIHPHYNGLVKLIFSLRDWPSPKRMPLEKLRKWEPGPNEKKPSVWYPGNMAITDHNSKETETTKAWMISATEGRQTKVAQIMDARWPKDLSGIKTKTNKEENGISIELEFQAEAKAYTFYKYVAVQSSHQVSDPLKAANQAIDSIQQTSYEVLFAEHAKAWQQLWQTDIEVEGNPELQKLIHSMIFYLLCSISKDTNFSIPPMGLSSDGYYGHVFWDADTWMFPPLLVMHPELAKSIVMFRYQTLDGAKRKAKELGFRGAMYPWEADELGNETTPEFAAQNAKSEIHITGDVALAQWQYYLATSDKDWLKNFGYPVIEQTAEFWISRISWNEKDKRYEIDRVVSVDEGLIGIKNDTYTNSIAKKNLEIAISASRVLGLAENPVWKKVADGIFVPYNEKEAYHPPYENAPDVALGSVVSLLSYPLQIPMSDETKRNNLTQAVTRLEKKGAGAMMGTTLLPVVAAELGDRDLMNRLIPKTYEGYLRPPFNSLSETPKNQATNFVTGAGGFLQQAIFGYTGLRITEDGLTKKFSPLLPSSIQKLRLKNFRVRNQRFDFETRRGRGLRWWVRSPGL